MNQWNGTKKLTTAPKEACTRPLCFAACIPCLSLKKKKRRLSPLVLLLSSGRHAKFPRGQKLCPTSVRSSTKHAVESPQVSNCLTGGFIHCPSSWHRIASARVWKRNRDGGDRPPSVIRTCRSVSVCPVLVDPLLSHAREMRWGGGGWGEGGGGTCLACPPVGSCASLPHVRGEARSARGRDGAARG